MLDDRDARHLDSLLKSYGELQVTISKMEERQDTAKENRERLERTLIENKRDLQDSIVKLRNEMVEEFTKINKKLADRRWSPSQYALILVALISGVSTVLAVVLTRAPT